MTEQPEAGHVDGPPAAPPPRLALVLAAVVVLGFLLDLFCLFLLPFRLGGHLVPLGPLLVLALNAGLGAGANRLAQERAPAQVLLAVALVLSALAPLRGPGGDLVVTRDLQGMYLLFVITACIGAGVPLFRRARSA